MGILLPQLQVFALSLTFEKDEESSVHLSLALEIDLKSSKALLIYRTRPAINVQVRSLDSEFRDHHLQLVDLIDDDPTLEKEQDTLNKLT